MSIRVLIVSPAPFVSRTLGATKAIMDAADALRAAGAHCDIYPQDQHGIDASNYFEKLQQFLQSNARQYDLIEVADSLPLSFRPLIGDRLLVIRSALLLLHRKTIHFPELPSTFKSRINHWIRGASIRKKKQQQLEETLKALTLRLKEADLINVQNSRDRDVLLAEGIAPEKIALIPCGIDDDRLAKLQRVELQKNHSPQCVFVGTFDFRKGCLDLVKIFMSMSREIPGIRLKILGAQGLMTRKHQVLQFFPKHLRKHVTVIMKFSEQSLPSLLQDCDVGLFPSYWEGFGIGVVEMLAAGLPVVAYDAPGPCDILPGELLMQPGDTASIAKKALELLKTSNKSDARERYRSISIQYRWSKIGQMTANIYEEALQRRRFQ